VLFFIGDGNLPHYFLGGNTGCMCVYVCVFVRVCVFFFVLWKGKENRRREIVLESTVLWKMASRCFHSW